MSDKPAKVVQIEGELFRFYVRSANGGGEYLVDIEERKFQGECSCPHYTCRLAPKIAQGERGSHLRCKHIQAARDFALDLYGGMIANHFATLHEQRVHHGHQANPEEGDAEA